jgi:hypothetical protein
MPGANIGSPSMRVSEGLEVYFTLAGFVPVDKFVLRKPARSVAVTVLGVITAF